METIEYQNNELDKKSWGEGPWLNEPDKKQWMDEETKLPCLIVRGPVGALCGYVGVTKDHPYYGLDYLDIEDIDVHGGLTFANRCNDNTDESTGICHKSDDPSDVWWLGFDCAHAGDLCPSINAMRDSMNLPQPMAEAYRDFEYVTAQVEWLASQIEEDKEKKDD